MPRRRIERGSKFDRDLRLLARRHPELPDTIEEVLRRYSAEGPSDRYRQPGVGGLPVFKERLPLQGMGKRGAARIIVFCDAERIVALRLYTKADIRLLTDKEIREALRDAGLLEDSDPSTGE